MKGWISIQEVLADMERVAEDGSLYTFSISFVRANDSKNGRKGSIKEVKRASKYTKQGKKKSSSSTAGLISSDWKFKDHQAIPIQDLSTHQLLTPKWTHIITYNEQKVKHYG